MYWWDRIDIGLLSLSSESSLGHFTTRVAHVILYIYIYIYIYFLWLYIYIMYWWDRIDIGRMKITLDSHKKYIYIYIKLHEQHKL